MHDEQSMSMRNRWTIHHAATPMQHTVRGRQSLIDLRAAGSDERIRYRATDTPSHTLYSTCNIHPARAYGSGHTEKLYRSLVIYLLNQINDNSFNYRRRYLISYYFQVSLPFDLAD